MLELRNISKDYKSGKQITKALRGVSLYFRKQEFVCIVGPSGCGKTTLLNIIGGLDTYTDGDLIIYGKSTQKFQSKDWDGYRNQMIGFVFQNYNLIPQLTVYENVELALTLSGITRKERKEKVLKTLESVGLENEINKYPNELSGGQMQRVAIARAIVNNPDIILADEPTGALDSQTATQIVEVLKEISKNRLVIMVTHNQELAKKYATRIISLRDGKVIDDTNRYQDIKNKENYLPRKSAMKFSSALKLSFKNLIVKKLRTILIVIAGSVGIISVTLVLTISNSVNTYIEDIQKVTLGDQPITIMREYNYDDPFEEPIDLEKYPDSDIIPIVNQNRSYYSTVNNLSEAFIEYLYKLDSNLYNFIDLRREVRMHFFTETTDGILRTTSGFYFHEISPDRDFIEKQYDCIWGKMPQETNEIALLIDINNSLDARVLQALGYDYQEKDYYTFEEITQKEFRLGLNDYLYKEMDGYFQTNLDYQEIYDNGFPLKITGILRASKTNNVPLYQMGMLYTDKLSQFMIENALISKVVKEQLKYGWEKNVLDSEGKPFEDYISPSLIQTKEYLYEMHLIRLSIKAEVSSIRIYTDQYRHRNLINDYLKAYNDNQNEEDKIRYYDYFGSITREFDTFVQVLTKVLIAFSGIALFVSTIMVGIITYVSVMERIKEIGILRSLGARKIDIANVFNAETGIIGFSSGLLGTALGIILLKPIVRIIISILKQNNITTFDLTQMDVMKANPLLLIIILLASVALTLIAGIIPAIIAALKSPTVAIRNE